MGSTGLRSALCLVVIGCAEPIESTGDQAATVCASGPTVRGMDVSYYEASVDWAAAHQAGIDFAFIRVTDGVQFIDPKFPSYWTGAKAAGVIRGAYQFFRPAEDPIAQADLLLEKMGPLDPGDLPPVLDVEVSGGLSTDQVAAGVRAWVAHVTAKLGRTPILYAGLYSWHDLTGSADITTSPLWVAQYTSAPCPNIPAPWTRWAFWQYSATGTVAGIPGSMLDVNVFNGTLDDLRGQALGGACGTIAPGGGTIDDGDPCFVAGGPAQYLRHVDGAGDQGDLIWTHATPSATEANFTQWDLNLAEAGRYRVEAFTPHAYATSTRAAYVVKAAGAPARFAIDQSTADGWQVLGELDFAAGGAQWVHLGDNTGEATATAAQLVFDAVRLVRVDAAPPTMTPPPATTDDVGTGGCTTGSGAGLATIAWWLAVRRRRLR